MKHGLVFRQIPSHGLHGHDTVALLQKDESVAGWTRLGEKLGVLPVYPGHGEHGEELPEGCVGDHSVHDVARLSERPTHAVHPRLDVLEAHRVQDRQLAHHLRRVPHAPAADQRAVAVPDEVRGFVPVEGKHVVHLQRDFAPSRHSVVHAHGHPGEGKDEDVVLLAERPHQTLDHLHVLEKPDAEPVGEDDRQRVAGRRQVMFEVGVLQIAFAGVFRRRRGRVVRLVATLAQRAASSALESTAAARASCGRAARGLEVLVERTDRRVSAQRTHRAAGAAAHSHVAARRRSGAGIKAFRGILRAGRLAVEVPHRAAVFFVKAAETNVAESQCPGQEIAGALVGNRY
mmetsp:Transcript_26053/g.65658  ORF Transcript_26053/g.65658 Transcript_26053/m.65658 type:complete len:345 (-) Transcript_26053:3673-4707(-)